MGVGLSLNNPSLCCGEDTNIAKYLLDSNHIFIRETHQNDSKVHDGYQYILNPEQKSQKTAYGALFLRQTKQCPGLYYQGQISDRKAHGKGKLSIFKQSEPTIFYQGYFYNNCAHSLSESEMQDEDSIESTYQRNNITFKGKWQNGKPLKGKLIVPNQSYMQESQKQEAQKKETQKQKTYWINQLNLNTNLVDTEGFINVDLNEQQNYTGNIKKNNNWYVYHGNGRITYRKGSDKEQWYEGSWQNGQMHGKGQYKWPNGHKFVGQYQNGIKSGFGRYFQTSQKYFEGEWVEGLKNGKFKFVVGDNEVYFNEFVKDVPSGFTQNSD